MWDQTRRITDAIRHSVLHPPAGRPRILFQGIRRSGTCLPLSRPALSHDLRHLGVAG